MALTVVKKSFLVKDGYMVEPVMPASMSSARATAPSWLRAALGDQVEFEDRAEIVDVDALDRNVEALPGVVDDNVDTRAGVECRLHGLGDLPGVTCAAHRDRVGKLSGQFLDAVFAAGNEYDACAGPARCSGGCSTDAR